MICMVSGVEIHDGDVWIVEIVGEECTPTYRYILRAETDGTATFIPSSAMQVYGPNK